MSLLPQTNNQTIAFERYIDLALDDKIPWDEFVVLMNTFITSFDNSQKFIMALLNSLKNLKMKFLNKKKEKNIDLINLEDSNVDEISENSVPRVNEDPEKFVNSHEAKICIESVTSLKDSSYQKESENSMVSTLKTEPANERDFVFENEFIKREKVETFDKDVVLHSNHCLIFQNNQKNH